MVLPHKSERLGYSEVQITPDFLKADNLSKLARFNLTKWSETKERKNGEIILFIVCGDSRIVTADIADDVKIASISSIAGSGDLEPFKHMLRHQAFGQIVVVGHFNHEKIVEGKGKGRLGGCGGVDAAIKIDAKELQIEGKELSEYIGENVTPDFFENVKKTVQQVSSLSGKPVLGVMVDHLTDAAFPFIQINPRGEEVDSIEADLEKFQWRQIRDIEAFIKNKHGHNFPQLKTDHLLPEFKKFIWKNRKKALERYKQNPRLIETQREQNPSTVVISTCPIPIALRYPGTLGRPNSNEAFVIRKAFNKGEEEGEITKNDIDFMSIVGQLYYPLKQADFSRTSSILIETPDLEMSAQIADRLLKIPFVQDWVNRRQGKIMMAQLENHKTKDIQYFPSAGNQ